MKPSDRTLALNAAWAALWWLVDPEHNRWTKTLEVLNDPASRVTIERGSSDDTGRRSVGGHSDPTGDAAGAVLDAGLECRKQVRELHRTVSTVAESARFLVATMTEQPYDGPDTIEHAISDIVWLCTVPHSAEAWRTADDAERNEFDHAIENLHRQALLLANQCRAILGGAVKEKPSIKQPKRSACRAHARSGRPDVLAVRKGLCEECAAFHDVHKVDPHEPIHRAWDYGRRRMSTALIAEAKAEATRRRRRKAG